MIAVNLYQAIGMPLVFVMVAFLVIALISENWRWLVAAGVAAVVWVPLCIFDISREPSEAERCERVQGQVWLEKYTVLSNGPTDVLLFDAVCAKVVRG